MVDDRCVHRGLAKFLEIGAPSQINPSHAGVYMTYTNTYPSTEEWTGKQGNGIVTNRIIINIRETSKQRDQCFSGIEVDKLITTNQYSGSYIGAGSREGRGSK